MIMCTNNHATVQSFVTRAVSVPLLPCRVTDIQSVRFCLAHSNMLTRQPSVNYCLLSSETQGAGKDTKAFEIGQESPENNKTCQ